VKLDNCWSFACEVLGARGWIRPRTKMFRKVEPLGHHIVGAYALAIETLLLLLLLLVFSIEPL